MESHNSLKRTYKELKRNVNGGFPLLLGFV